MPMVTFPKFLMGFSSATSMRTKFKVRSFTCSRDIKGYTKTWGSPCICPRSLLSKIFNELFFAWTLKMFRPNLKSAASLIPDSSDWSFGWGLRTPNIQEEEAIGGWGWYRSKESCSVRIGPL